MKRVRLLAWGWVGLIVVLTAAGLAIHVWEHGRVTLGLGDVVFTLLGLLFPSVGALIISRHPRNPIGWLLALHGLLGAGAHLSVILGVFAQGDARLWVALLEQFFWTPAVLPLFTLLPLLFPTGRLPSRRWRWAAWCAIGAIGLLWIGGTVLNPNLVTVQGERLRNPAAVTGDAFLYEGLLSPFATLFLVVAAVAAAVAVVSRLRHATGEERLQLRWFAFATVIVVMAFIVAGLLDSLGNRPLGGTILGVGIALLPVSIGIAVLKYRLYDIDLVISKTVVFAGLAGFITAVYVAIVVGLGSLIGAGGEPNLGLSIVATAAVAVAFQPARERLTRVANRLVYGRRATPYEVLSRFSAQVGETVATEQTLGHMARLLAEGTGAARAQVWLKVGEQMRSAASWPEEAVPDFAPLINVEGSLPEFAEVDLAVPVSHDGQLLGALTITKKRGEPVNPTERNLIEDLAAQAGLVLRNVGLTADLRARLEELRDSRRRLVEAQDQGRRRLERDLHDGAQQQLVALKIKLGLAKRLAERDGATQAAGLVDQLIEETDDAVAALRELAHGIYPPLLAAEGLEGALRARAAKAPIPVTVQADGVGRFSQEVEAAVYFCVLEAIQNAVKYAHATHITARLTHSDGQLTFQVSDDGVGFDPAITPRGHGLTNMADRLDALGGNVEIQSAAGGGVRVVGRLPVSTTAAVL